MRNLKASFNPALNNAGTAASGFDPITIGLGPAGSGTGVFAASLLDKAGIADI
ncbi:hypothetical protein NCH01_29500 [Neoasaia chiangmaiensis]|nr:hypothetical protein NCH01_29500 [Neoasaia chiangmaiensis]